MFKFLSLSLSLSLSLCGVMALLGPMPAEQLESILLYLALFPSIILISSILFFPGPAHTSFTTWFTSIQGVTGPYRQNDRDDRPCREDNFLWRNMYSQTCRSWVMRSWRCSPVRVGIEYRQSYTYHFIEIRHVFTIRVQTVGHVPHCMFDIVAATIGQQGRATGPPRPIYCSFCPQRKKIKGR